MTYFEPPPPSFQNQNVDYVIQHNSPVASPSYLTSKIVNAALLNYFDEKSRRAAPKREQVAPSYLTSKVVNSALLKYFDQKFQNDAIRKQQEANANPVDNVPYNPDYIHPVTKSIPDLVHPHSLLEYYSNPDNSSPRQPEIAIPDKDDSIEEAPIPKEVEIATYKGKSAEKVPVLNEEIEEESAEEAPVPKDDVSDKIILINQDIRYNPDYRNDYNKAEQENLEKTKDAVNAAIKESYEELDTNHNEAVSSKRNAKYTQKNDNEKQIIHEINDNENFEVENLSDASEQQRQDSNEENEQEPRENIETRTETDNESESEEETKPERDIESDKEVENDNENEQKTEAETSAKAKNESGNEAESSENFQKEEEENKTVEQKKGDENEVHRPKESVAKSETKKQDNTQEDDIKDLDQFIEKHFSDFKIPDYESIKQEVRNKDSGVYYNEEATKNNENKEDDEGDQEILNQNEEDNEEEREEKEQEAGENKNESRQENDYESGENKDAKEEDEGEIEENQKEKEIMEKEEKDKIKALQELHEEEFYSIFPKLGEGSAIVHFFIDEHDNKNKESKLNTQVQTKYADPNSDEFYESFEYRSTQKPEESRTLKIKTDSTYLSSADGSKPTSKSKNYEKEDPIKNFNINNHYEKTMQDFLSNLASQDTDVKKYVPSNRNLINNSVSKNNFRDKNNHESTERTVVQPLYSGVWQIGTLEELHKSDKPVTVPFDYEYSATSNQEYYKTTEPSVRVRRATPNIEELLQERPQSLKEYDRFLKYSEDFTYEVPEPKTDEQRQASEKKPKYHINDDGQEHDTHKDEASNSAAKYIEDGIEEESRIFNQKVKQIQKFNNDLEYHSESTNPTSTVSIYGEKRGVPTKKQTNKSKNVYNKFQDFAVEPSQVKKNIDIDIGKLINYNQKAVNSLNRFKRSASKIEKFLEEKPYVLKDYDQLHKYTDDFTYEVPEPKTSEHSVEQGKEASVNKEMYQKKQTSGDDRVYNSKYIEDDIENLNQFFNQRVKQIKKDTDALEYSSDSTNQVPKSKLLKYGKKKGISEKKERYKKKNKTVKSRDDSSKESTNTEEEYIGANIGKLFRYLGEKPEELQEFDRYHEYNEDFTYEVPEPKIAEHHITKDASEKKENIKTTHGVKEISDDLNENSSDKQSGDDSTEVEEEYETDGSSITNELEKNNDYVADSYNQKFTYEIPEPTTPDYAKLEKKDYQVDESFSPNLQVTGNSSGRKKIKVTLDKPVHRVFK